MLQFNQLKIALLNVKGNLLPLLLFLGLNDVIGMQCFLYPIGGPKAVEDRDIEAQLDLPTGPQRKGIELNRPITNFCCVVADVRLSIIRIKYEVGQMTSPGGSDILILGSSLRLEALQFRPGLVRNFSCFVQVIRDRCHGRVFDQRPLG